jgi:hypothetical protein
MQKIAKKVKADRIIWGEVKKTSPKEVTAHLRLWQNGKTQKDSTFTYSKNLTDDTDDALLALAETALEELVGPAKGTLIISAGNVDGQVLVNGLPFGMVKGGQATLEVPTGELVVQVKAPGYEELSETVEVAAGETATINLDPVALPEGAAPEEPEADVAPEPDRPMNSKTTWGIAALGIGGAGLVAGTVFWIVSYNQATDREFEAYVNATPRDQDPCVRARDEGARNITDICDSNVTSRYLAYTMFGLGAVLTGVGAYLLLTGEDSSKMQAEGVRIQPRIGLGPRAGQLDLQLSF